jgi:hypothetical protein
MKNRKREICTSGSVRDEDGQHPHLLGRRTFLHLAAGVAALPGVSRFAWAQSYPARPVKIIVGQAAGSGSDLPPSSPAEFGKHDLVVANLHARLALRERTVRRGGGERSKGANATLQEAAAIKNDGPPSIGSHCGNRMQAPNHPTAMPRSRTVFESSRRAIRSSVDATSPKFMQNAIKVALCSASV